MTHLIKPVRRVTREPFFSYGPDRDRKFVASLVPGDLLTLRPQKCRADREVSIRLVDVYRYVLQCRELSRRLEKARAVKARKDAARRTRKLAAEVRRENRTP